MKLHGDLDVLGDGKDVFVQGDASALWHRFVNWNRNPQEHWPLAVDELTWSGWASYNGYVTPSNISRFGSKFYIAHSSTARAFYRRPYINGQTEICAACANAGTGSEVGIMVDDGVGNADGEGANNFFRIFFSLPAGTNVTPQLTYEYRTGGGSVTSITMGPVSWGHFHAAFMRYGIGTRWSNWSLYALMTGDMHTGMFINAPLGGQTWTPAWHGLYYRATNTNRAVVWDWFEEA